MGGFLFDNYIKKVACFLKQALKKSFKYVNLQI